MPIVTIRNGVQYREIYLDINQTGANPLLSLNQLQIFQTNGDAGAVKTTVTTNPVNGATHNSHSWSDGSVPDVEPDQSV